MAEQETKLDEFRLRVEGPKVHVILNCKLIAVMDPEPAVQLGKNFRLAGKRAEQYLNPSRLITDQAILHRAGIQLGLTDDPMMKKEALKESKWDPILRRLIPKSKAKGPIPGTPKLIQLPPRSKPTEEP